MKYGRQEVARAALSSIASRGSPRNGSLWFSTSISYVLCANTQKMVGDGYLVLHPDLHGS